MDTVFNLEIISVGGVRKMFILLITHLFIDTSTIWLFAQSKVKSTYATLHKRSGWFEWI